MVRARSFLPDRLQTTRTRVITCFYTESCKMGTRSGVGNGGLAINCDGSSQTATLNRVGDETYIFFY